MEMSTYFADFNNVLMACLNDSENKKGIIHSIDLLKQTRLNASKIFLIGNGGSSAIAEHMAVDLTKNAGLRAMTISGTPMLTTLANDCGYEQAYAKAVEAFGEQQDVLIAISSSGASANILNASRKAQEKEMKVITFSGFRNDNPLRMMGDINIWVDSRAYGYVELIHNLLLHYINDAIIGSAEYGAQDFEKMNVGDFS